MKKVPRAISDEERKFLAEYDVSRFERMSVTVDVALLTADRGALKAMLIQRPEHPFRGHWSLPGGFVRLDESLDEAATRVMAAKAGAENVFLEQLYTFGEPNRDPRTRVITVAYYALIDRQQLAREWQGTDDVQLAVLRVPWKGERGGPVEALNEQGQLLPLAFDHSEILGLVVKRLRGKLAYAPLGFELLPPRFTLRDLQGIHETILGRRLNKDSFRRRMLASGLIAATGKREDDVGHRPAELYRFTSKPVR
jgi:8-oxo-dGTP diphosphatase